MNKSIKKSMFAFLLFFLCFDTYCREVQSIKKLKNIEWTMQTTNGFENIQNNLMSMEGGSTNKISQALQFTGILFHAYHLNKLFSKTQMNLGFSEKIPQFFWTDTPDFVHEGKSDLLCNLKCVEVDCQVFLPKFYIFDISLLPFVGYTFINYSYDEIFNTNYSSSFMYNCLNVGLEYSQRINARFMHNYFVTYSPLLVVKSGEGIMQYINYGAELITDTYPIAFTVFASFRFAMNNASDFIFRNTQINFFSSEIGLSFHLTL